MKNKLRTIGLAFACFSMMFALIAMLFVTAFPATPEQDKIAEENRERAKVRAEMYKDN